MIILNGHQTVSTSDFLSQQNEFSIFCKNDVIPEQIRRDVYELREGRTPDLLTPLLKGKQWLFELLLEHQPRTGALLMEAGDLFLRQTRIFGSSENYVLDLGLEVKGKVVLIERSFWNSNPSDPEFEPVTIPDGRQSLPTPLREAYFHRLNGLHVPAEVVNGIAAYLLPKPNMAWPTIDYYLDDFPDKKKQLAWFDERFPQLAPKDKREWRYGFRNLLNTRAYWDMYDITNKPPKYPIDGLFFKHEPQDRVIYHVEDGRFDEMRIVENPVDVVDRYCEHVLLNRTNRFDFRQYTIELD